jgi:hypothetical protein
MTFRNDPEAKREEDAIKEINKIPPKLVATLQTINFSTTDLSDLNDIYRECREAKIDISALNRRQPENWNGPDDPGFKLITAMVRRSWLSWRDGGVKPKKDDDGFDAKEIKPIKRIPIHRRF